MREYLTRRIGPEEEGVEVLSILRNGFRLSSRKIRSVKQDPQGILLDEIRVTVRQVVHEGQILKVLLEDSVLKEDHILPGEVPLRILYEDRDLLILNKPAGLCCHPSKGHYNDTLANGVRSYLDQKEERSSIHLVGRLDKDTSGVVTIAKNSIAAERLTDMRKAGQIRKEYLAIVHGCLEPGCGRISIGMEEFRDPEDGMLKMRRGSMEAITDYEVVRMWEDYSLIRLLIQTGRMHQIRFHMSESGVPLLGDPIYGRRDGGDPMGRTALHARRISFRQPLTDQWIDVEAPVAEDMEHLIKEME